MAPSPGEHEVFQRWGRRLLVASALLFAWSAVILVTGGFLIEVGPLRVSSRNANRVLLLAAAAAVVAWRLAYREWVHERLRRLPPAVARLEQWLRASESAFDRLAVLLVWTMAAALVGCGLIFGSRVAGGADGFGYISASALWQHGRLGLDQAYAASLPWPHAIGSFVPLAYRLGADGVMGPTVAPGLPLLMALAGWFSTCGPYLVVPLCGAILILSTFHLGRRLFGSTAALVASALVACSPVVVFESLVVMADIPAAAMWIAALAIASGAPRATLASGLLSGIAIAIRPNLLPLALFPWLMSIVRCGSAPALAARTALFGAGSVPAALFIAWVNARLYGSPFSSGYGDLGGAFAMTHAMANLRLYPGWWLESQGAVGFLFLATAVRRHPPSREVLVLSAFAICAGLVYVFYLPFDQWWYLRFLLPAIPIVWLLTAEAVDRLTRRSLWLRIAALTTLMAVAGGHAFRFMDAKDILANRVAEQRRYLDAALHLDRTLPAEAVVLAMQHSGSVRYYTGRLTMRWDVLDPAWLDRAVAALASRGIPVHALLESWEAADFQTRFAGQGTVDRLKTGVSAISADGELRLYDLSALTPPRDPGLIPVRPEPGCVEGSARLIDPEAAQRLRGVRQ